MRPLRPLMVPRWHSPPLPLTEETVQKPHYYEQKTWVGNVKRGATPESAYELLRKYTTPFQGGRRLESAEEAVRGGNPFASAADRTDIPIGGPVKHEFFPEHRTIVNTTEKGHHFHSGNVHRTIVQEGDDLYVVTRGYGTGWQFPVPKVLWWLVDQDIRRKLAPAEAASPLSPLSPQFRSKSAENDSDKGIEETSNLADPRAIPTAFGVSGPLRGALTAPNMLMPLPPLADPPFRPSAPTGGQPIWAVAPHAF